MTWSSEGTMKTTKRWPPFVIAVSCGVAIMLQGLGLALPLPIPGTNWIFIIPVILYAIGLLEDDGLLTMICHALTAVQLALAVWAWDAVCAAVAGVFR